MAAVIMILLVILLMGLGSYGMRAIFILALADKTSLSILRHGSN